MPSGIYKKTKEHKVNIGLANKGKNKNKRNSIQTEFKKGQIPWNKGTKGVCKSWSKGKKFPEWSGKNHPNWKGGKIIDKGYILIYVPIHPFAVKGKVYEHRIVAEKCLNRFLTSEEKIHHINGIKDDNRPKNLYLFPDDSHHTKFHFLKNKPLLSSNLIH